MDRMNTQREVPQKCDTSSSSHYCVTVVTGFFFKCGSQTGGDDGWERDWYNEREKKMEHDITAGNSLLLRRKKSSKNHDFRENAACDWWLCSGSKTLLIFCICELKFKKKDSDFSRHFVQDTRSGWRHLVAGFYLSTWLPSSSSCMRYDLIYDDLFDCKADFLLQISLKNNTYMPTLCI